MALRAGQGSAPVQPPISAPAAPAWACSLLLPPTEWVLRGSSRPSRPQRCHFVVAIPGPTALAPTTLATDLAPVPKLGEWVDKMPLQAPEVNLWESLEVS